MIDTALDAAGFYLNVAVFTAAFYAAMKILEDWIDATRP